jgi:hypothetical protein
MADQNYSFLSGAAFYARPESVVTCAALGIARVAHQLKGNRGALYPLTSGSGTPTVAPAPKLYI